MELLTILMNRDNLSKAEASDLISEMRQAVLNGEDPEELLYDIGLEPDYIFDILPY
jgi:hypothetical protein